MGHAGLDVGGSVEGDLRAKLGVGKEGPSWELAGVVMLWPCDRAALVGEGANLYPAEVAEGEDVQGSGVRCMVEAGGACLVEHHYAKGIFSGVE